MKKIAIDAMGGDNAPQALVEGANQALRDFSDIEIVLYGDEAKIKPLLTATEHVSIVHTDEKIDSDDEPTKAIRKKKQASMVLAAKAVKAGEADAVLSAGNTGALLAAGFFIVGRIKNIDRPGLLSTLPTVDGRGFDMLDLGANAENTPHHLHQYAILGSFYAENVRGIKQPRVGLLNNGTEASKGDPLRKETYALLSEDDKLNFIGNVEANEAMMGTADVIVTDGFTGNVMLKTMEGVGSFAGSALKAMFKKNLLTKLAALCVMPGLNAFKAKLDPNKVGGTAFIGISRPVIKAHGSSNAEAIENAMGQAVQVARSGIIRDIEENVALMKVERE